MKNILSWVRFFLLGVVSAAVVVYFTFPLPGVIPVLMYHYIGTKEEAAREKNFITADTFKSQMDFLKRFGYRVISMDEYYAIKRGKQKPKGREIVITFDDAHYTFREAYDILKSYEFPVTMFVVSEAVKGNLKNGSLDLETLKQMSANHWLVMEGHTKTHPLLSQLTPEQIDDEIAGSKNDLEEMFGKQIRFLAYSSGDFDQQVIDVVKKAGYLMAFTTSHKRLKAVPPGPYAITRLKISEDNLFIFWGQISGIYQEFKAWRHRVVQKASQNPSKM